ncbi:MAG TPA: PhoH family protein [Desulfuromonadales bacterium]|nr:PhoH family protein [Desulfuromonadales bacterium]
MAQKIYVLDTNVLLHDPNALFSFEDNEVVVPLPAIEELDRFKRDGGEVGRNARQTARHLDELRGKGVLTNGGVPLENGGRLRVIFSHSEQLQELPPEIRKDNADNRILAIAFRERERKQLPVILVTKDVNLRIKAHAVGLTVEDYETDKISYDTLYPGSAQIQVPAERINLFYRQKSLCLDECPGAPFFPHQCLSLIAEENPQQSALGRVSADGRQLRALIDVPGGGFWGIVPRNREQRFALDLLIDPHVQLVTLVGKAGTGKTLLAIAAGLFMVTDQNAFRRLLISRPVVPMGRDLGYLPGGLDQKLEPWMLPVYDNIELLLNGVDENGAKKRGHQELVEMGYLEVEAPTYIRGRSIPNQYLVVDETQNLTPHEVKTIITRAGEGTKIVLTGDPDQIDNPYVDAGSNGLTYVVERFRDRELAGHIILSRGERSQLAEMASDVL